MKKTVAYDSQLIEHIISIMKSPSTTEGLVVRMATDGPTSCPVTWVELSAAPRLLTVELMPRATVAEALGAIAAAAAGCSASPPLLLTLCWKARGFPVVPAQLASAGGSDVELASLFPPRCVVDRLLINCGSVAAPEAPPKEAISSSSLHIAPVELSKMTDAERNEVLGEKLFKRVFDLQPKLAGKITGMLLELDNDEILDLLRSKRALEIRVDEAIGVLQEFAYKYR